MPKLAEEKSAVWCRKVTAPGLHAAGGVSGLLLRVTDTGAKYWLLRARVRGGKRRDIGIGPFPEISLAAARDRARELKAQIRAGIDPVAERSRAVAERRAEQAKQVTFREATERMLADKEAEWRNIKHRQQWRNTLEQYAGPVIGDLPVAAIETAHVFNVLQPIWAAKTETARRVRGRIEAVLDWALPLKLRTGENPARWKKNLDKVLPKPEKITKVQHHRALPWLEVPEFMAELRKREGMGARALEFAILTAARSGEVRGATWQEIGLERRLWSIPAERMKAGLGHAVPLSGAAVALLKSLERPPEGGLVFPATKGGMLSDMTLSAVLRRMGADCTVHGFRSCFKDWARSSRDYPDEVSELCLAHVSSDATRAAYARDGLFPHRAGLLTDWARYCNGETPAGGEMVPNRGRQ